MKGLKEKLVAKPEEDQQRDCPRPTNEIQPHRRGKTHETGLGVDTRYWRMMACCHPCEVRQLERQQGQCGHYVERRKHHDADTIPRNKAHNQVT